MENGSFNGLQGESVNWAPLAPEQQQSERSGSRPPRAHDSWNRFVDALQGDMTSDELATLSWPTVKDLAQELGFTKPLDAAHIQLAWQERHITLEEQKEYAVIAIRNAEEDRKKQEEINAKAAEEAQALADERAKKKGYMGGALKTTTTTRRTATGAKSATGATNTTPVKQSTASTRGIFQSPLQQQQAASPVAQPPASQPVQARPLVAQPVPIAQSASPPAPQQQQGYFVDPVTFQKSPSPNLHTQSYRVDTGKSDSEKAKASMSRSQSRNDVICIQDLKAVFTKYASFGAGGNAEEGIDSTRFAKLCKECNLIDKVFTVREADVLFQSCKLSTNDRKMPYHQFRMRLVPELAGKKRVSINDIVRICCYRLTGAEEEQRQKQRKVRQAQARRRELEAEQQARDEFSLQEQYAAEAEAEAAARAEAEAAAQRPQVPPLRRAGSITNGSPNAPAASPKKVLMKF